METFDLLTGRRYSLNLYKLHSTTTIELVLHYNLPTFQISTFTISYLFYLIQLIELHISHIQYVSYITLIYTYMGIQI